MPLVWNMPDGSIRVTQIATRYLERHRRAGEATDALVMRLAPAIQQKTPGLATGTPLLVRTADMPQTRAERANWCVQDGKVVVRQR
jgi:hypothetical protein